MTNYITSSLQQQGFSENTQEQNACHPDKEPDLDFLSSEERAEELENEFYESNLPPGFYFDGDDLATFSNV